MNMMLKWFKKRQEDKTVSDNVLADKVCKVWNNLDASILDQYYCCPLNIFSRTLN